MLLLCACPAAEGKLVPTGPASDVRHVVVTDSVSKEEDGMLAG